MTKRKMYRYVGTNGTLTTYILLDGVKRTDRYHLSADEGMLLTDGERTAKVVEINAEDLDKWYEVRDPQADIK